MHQNIINALKFMAGTWIVDTSDSGQQVQYFSQDTEVDKGTVFPLNFSYFPEHSHVFIIHDWCGGAHIHKVVQEWLVGILIHYAEDISPRPSLSSHGHPTKFASQSLISNIQITGLLNVAFDVVFLLINTEFQDQFTSVKSVL